MKRLTRKQRLDYLQAHPLCAECGQQAEQVHHIKMIQDGGGNEWDNLKALCCACHEDADHAKCVGRMTFTLDGEGEVESLEIWEAP